MATSHSRGSAVAPQHVVFGFPVENAANVSRNSGENGNPQSRPNYPHDEHSQYGTSDGWCACSAPFQSVTCWSVCCNGIAAGCGCALRGNCLRNRATNTRNRSAHCPGG